MHDSPNQSRILAKLIRELLAAETFESLSDLAAALKGRCARLKLKVTDEAINAAFRMIASNTELTAPDPKLRRAAAPDHPEVPGPVIGHAEAAAILAQLKVRLVGGRIARPRSDAPGGFPKLMEVK